MATQNVVEAPQGFLTADDVGKRLVKKVQARSKRGGRTGTSPGTGAEGDAEGILCKLDIGSGLERRHRRSKRFLEIRIHVGDGAHRGPSQLRELLFDDRQQALQPAPVG